MVAEVGAIDGSVQVGSGGAVLDGKEVEVGVAHAAHWLGPRGHRKAAPLASHQPIPAQKRGAISEGSEAIQIRNASSRGPA